MNQSSAESAVVVAAMVTLASTSFASLSTGEFKSGGFANSLPSGRTVAGTFLAFAVLGMITEVAPEIGVGLSVAVAGTAFTLYGLPTILHYFGNSQDQKFLARLKVNG